MPTLIVCDKAGYDPQGNPYHGQLMLDAIAVVGVAPGWTVRAIEGFFTAIEEGHKLFVIGSPPEDIAHWIPKLLEHGAVCICAHQGFDLHRYPSTGGPLWPLVSVTCGTHGLGERAVSTLGWGPGLWGVVQTIDGWNAPSWAAAQTAALLTQYPEAAADPQAAAVRWASSLTPGPARWSERVGFGTALIRSRSLVGSPVREGDAPTSNVLYSPGCTKTSVAVAGQTDAWRYTCLNVRHPFLAAYRSMPAGSAGQGLRWTFYAHNHHATQAVRLRARNGNVFVWLEPGESGTYSLDVPYHGDAFFIETTAPQYHPLGDGSYGYFITGGAVDVTVASLRQDVYAMTEAPVPVAPAGGALSPLLSVQPEGAPGRYRAKITPLGTAAASVRVNGVEALATTASEALLYLPGGAVTVEARGLLPGGALTEAHLPGTASVTVAQGYVPPAPTPRARRDGDRVHVRLASEAAEGFQIDVDGGDGTTGSFYAPGEKTTASFDWPRHSPAKVDVHPVFHAVEFSTATFYLAGETATPAESGVSPILGPIE